MNDATQLDNGGWVLPRTEGPGGTIGPYTLRRRLGQGGFGVVFEADQEQPIKRRVALKIVKLGMDTHEVIGRFQSERQALAIMDHPHIAHVLDAGATESGRPYFVMELVEGQSISSYCNNQRLSIRDRLVLFDQVCTAVQHAHTKGIIHRDLKPGNVLVTTVDGQPFAKVIDFGIAKAMSGKLTDRTVLTDDHQIIGTPLYMSPEQAEGSADIDTRTDIYSLGVILYELLTGTTPVDTASLRSALFTELQRIICEVEPPRPSARLAEATTTRTNVAEERATDPRRLTRTVRGELDWIVMKALEKDRRRRYETAGALALDLRRYLAAEPVSAAPPSVAYRVRKFVRRHKGPVAAGSLVAASLVAGIAAFAWQAHIAQARTKELEQVSAFQASMLAQVDPTAAGKRLSEDVRSRYDAALAKAGVSDADRATEVAAFGAQWARVNATDTARDLIDRTILRPAVTAIDTQFTDQPKVDAELREVLAGLYVNMGLYESARPLALAAAETQRRVLGDDHPATLMSIDKAGEVLLGQGLPAEAEPYFREALETRRRTLGNDHPDTMNGIGNLALLLKRQGKYPEAERYNREAIEKLRRVRGDESPDLLLVMNNLAVVLIEEGKLEEAERIAREARDKNRKVLGPLHPNTLLTINTLARVLEAEGKLSEAEGYYREALDARRRELGENHPSTLISMNNLAGTLEGQDKIAEAETYYREALEKRRRLQGDLHPETIIALSNMGLIRRRQGRMAEAEGYYREAIANGRKTLGEQHSSTLISIISLGIVLVAEAKHAEAVRMLTAIEPVARKAFTGANERRVGVMLVSLGSARAGLREFAAGETALIEAQSILERARGAKHRDTIEAVRALADLYSAWDAADRGRGHDAQAAALRKKLDAPR